MKKLLTLLVVLIGLKSFGQKNNIFTYGVPHTISSVTVKYYLDDYIKLRHDTLDILNLDAIKYIKIGSKIYSIVIPVPYLEESKPRVNNNDIFWLNGGSQLRSYQQLLVPATSIISTNLDTL